MSILERVYTIERLLKRDSGASMRDLQDALEVSRATIKRDIEYLRDRLNAPIRWDRRFRVYKIEGEYTLPALYLSQAEIQALLVLHHLVARVNPSIAQMQLEPLRALLPKFVNFGEESTAEIIRRVKILQIGSRYVSGAIFETVIKAVLSRLRLRVAYWSRTRGEHSDRVISPQRLIYYRDNWYVDAWCHMRNGLRSFAADAIQTAAVVDEPAFEVADDELDRELGTGYGIFAGSNTRIALLRFSPLAARWVAVERWHKDQSGRFDIDDSYLLSLPYSDNPELIGDILRYGPDVEVIEPIELRSQIKLRLDETAKKY